MSAGASGRRRTCLGAATLLVLPLATLPRPTPAAAASAPTSAAAPAAAAAAPSPVAAVGASSAPAKGAPAVAARKGEAFTFSLRLGPIEGGRARLSIAPPVQKGGERLIHVLGQAEAVGIARVLTQLRDDYHVVLDADTLSPRRMEISESGLRERTVRAEFAGPRTSILVHGGSGDFRIAGPRYGEARDPIAAFLVMRAARLREGDRLDLVVLDGAALYEGHVEVQGREAIKLAGEAGDAGGERRAIRLRCYGQRIDRKGKSPVREATLWLSDDAERVPLRLVGETDLGQARVELTSHEPPRRPLPPPRRLPGVTEHAAAPDAVPAGAAAPIPAGAPAPAGSAGAAAPIPAGAPAPAGSAGAAAPVVE